MLNPPTSPIASVRSASRSGCSLIRYSAPLCPPASSSAVKQSTIGRLDRARSPRRAPPRAAWRRSPSCPPHRGPRRSRPGSPRERAPASRRRPRARRRGARAAAAGRPSYLLSGPRHWCAPARTRRARARSRRPTAGPRRSAALRSPGPEPSYRVSIRIRSRQISTTSAAGSYDGRLCGVVVIGPI